MVVLPIATLLGLALLARADLTGTSSLGFPLDDGWIHLQFARNLATGHGLAFNVGEWSAGSTSPLWTLLLAIPMAMGAPPVVAAKTLGVVLTVAVVLLAGALAHTITGSRTAAWVAGLALALSPRFAWAALSGMEVSLASALLLVTLLVYLRSDGHRTATWGALAALAGIARPELLPVVGVLIVHRVVWRPADIDPLPLAATRDVGRALAAFAAIFLIYASLNYAVGGTIFPTTFSAKSAPQGLAYALAALDARELARSLSSRVFENLSLLLRFFFDQSQLLFAVLVPGALAACGLIRTTRTPAGRADEEVGLVRPGSGVVVALLLVDAALMGAMAPDVPLYGQEGRYVLPLVALLFVLSGVGVAALESWTTRRWPVVLIAGLALARLASQDVQFAPRYTAQVANINQLHVAMGRWLAEHTPADAVVATNDIGGTRLWR